MRTIRLKIADLFELSGEKPPDGTPDVAALTPLVLKKYGFLPQPLIITVDGDDVVLQHPEEPEAARTEAARLAQKGAKKAAEGDYARAIETLKRALKLQPSLHAARRDLAMAYMEVGDVENASEHLVEVLRVNPADAWSWVVLGNLYVGPKQDMAMAEKFLRKALTLSPADPWALNSLAAICHKRGENEEAVRLFEQAIAANPEFANPYFGEAMVLASMGKPEQADETLHRLFAMGKLQDVRTQPVYEQARQLYMKVQENLARKNESEMFKCVQTYKADVEALSGYPVRIEEGEFQDKVGARIQMAWKHRRDHHLITTRRGYAPELLCHLEAHELTHLKMEAEARRAGNNKFFATTAKTRENAIRAVGPDLARIQRAGYSEESITQMVLSLVGGLCGFLFNCPLDMLIERHLRRSFPVLHPAQFLSIRVMAEEALAVNAHREVQKVTPRRILRATLALNGAYSLFLDDLFEGASTFAAPYRTMDNFDMAKRLYQHWMSRSDHLSGGGGSTISSTNLPTCSASGTGMNGRSTRVIMR